MKTQFLVAVKCKDSHIILRIGQLLNDERDNLMPQTAASRAILEKGYFGEGMVAVAKRMATIEAGKSRRVSA